VTGGRAHARPLPGSPLAVFPAKLPAAYFTVRAAEPDANEKDDDDAKANEMMQKIIKPDLDLIDEPKRE
jgi:hypothetical protein